MLVIAIAVGLLVAAGCAKYNTYYNAKKAFDEAEHQRAESIKSGADVETASRGQQQKYELAIDKSKKLLRDYPGHGLTDDALFLMGKSYHRLASYRESVRRLDQLFTNFPATEFMEEAVFLQAVNYLMLGDASRSQDLLDRLARQYPDSRFRSEALRSSGDNAFALERWTEAADSYSRFLERFPEAENWDDSALRMAESLWELARFEEAAEVLDDVLARSLNADRVFRARLLMARCRVRLGEYETVDEQVSLLKNQAEIYAKQGDVTLVEAENLIARGDLDGGMAMLLGMPDDQADARDVKAVRADMLGYGYIQQGDLEKAKESFSDAVTGGEILEDIDGTRLLLETIKDYLAAEGQLPDADPPRAATLRLIKANALLFGFDRPREALDTYAAVAADTAADSTAAPRALYGAMLVYENWFQQPDSAAIYRDELNARYPESPQAYQAQTGETADLLAFLLQQEEARLEVMRSDSTLTTDQLTGSGRSHGGRGTGLRRRMVYFHRRDNLVFPAPEAALLALSEKLAEARAEAAAAEAAVVAPDTGVASGVFIADAPLDTITFNLLPDHLRPESAVLDTTAAVATDQATETTVDPVAGAVIDSLVADPTVPKPETPPPAPPKKKKSRTWDL